MRIVDLPPTFTNSGKLVREKQNSQSLSEEVVGAMDCQAPMTQSLSWTAKVIDEAHFSM